MNQTPKAPTRSRTGDSAVRHEKPRRPVGLAVAPPAYGIAVIDAVAASGSVLAPRIPGPAFASSTSPGGVVQAVGAARRSGAATSGRSDGSGLPAALRAGVENLSGLPLDDVRVHRNSSRPAAVGALAFAQGTEIHLAPGQERHLPHEAWHVVQQKQGRVAPRLEVGGVMVNDDRSLEAEADFMAWSAKRAAAHQSVPERIGAGGAPSGQDATPRLGSYAGEIVQRVISTAGAEVTRNMTERFIFKHVLNAVDSATDWLQITNPLKDDDRYTAGQQHTSEAYAQALQRFNAPAGVTAQATDILELPNQTPQVRTERGDLPLSVQNAVRNGRTVKKDGHKYVPLLVQRGWKFSRIEADPASGNHMRYEARLEREFNRQTTAYMGFASDSGRQKINHFPAEANGGLF